MDPGGTGRGDDLFVTCLGAGIGDVLGDARREQDGVLEHDCVLVAQVGQPIISEIDAVEEDRAGGGVVEAHQQAHEGRLACTGRAADAYGRPRLYLEVHAVEHDVAPVIGEVDIAEDDCPLGPLQRSGIRSFGDVGGLIEE